MHHCAVQNAFAACEEMMRTSLNIAEKKEPVVCPKPRRIAPFNQPMYSDAVRPLRWQLSHPTDQMDSNASNELLDIILTKGEYVGCSPPYFCGSPPSRADNPLVQDARFIDGRESPVGRSNGYPSPSSSSATSSSQRKGFVRASFGHKPAAVRVEGFDCLDRDRRRCSIPAMA
ncbi:uncharacterized protein LOC18432091 isoform X2 [Amborella trichopoda]|uniref:uncharacterized protein LOC18432091 isoform X2 n=1 Tax=Amborella trichopoda TaxID=13333 RepID=UPI0005D379AB|nr:uncharacterized protein LOC18432091 isoform X2 [Amborella trichopoda]|eukprot:XP_011622574.1 uncharacterized protein LOC18432091 isoform X2 [Amborella trichopoda]